MSATPAIPEAAERARLAAATDAARMITVADELEQRCAQWCEHGAVGLDTEFVRERTFYPRPGLIQLSSEETAWFVDPVRLDDCSALAQLLDQPTTTKILHSVGEDMEVFRILTGTVPDPLFDTQMGAALLGYPLQCRYEQLVGETLDVELAGGKARSNWCKRPLSRDLLTYAAQDVIWLPRLHAHLAERLERVGRLAWLEEDCARLVENSRSESNTPALGRVKGAGRLPDPALAVLEALAEWRDGVARRRDLPRSFVIRDEDLLRLAESAVSGRLDAALAALPDPVRRRYRDDLAGRVEAGGRPDFSRPADLVALSPEQREWIRLAQQAVGQVAGELGIEAALVASKRELTRLARGERPQWLDGWRGPLLAELIER